MLKSTARVCAFVFCLGSASAGNADDTKSYDPLRLTNTLSSNAKPLDLIVTDTKRDRDIPILVHLPSEKSPAAVVMFSHGLGGSRHNNTFMARHWSARGYVVVNVQHPGSDESVWKKAKLLDRMNAMRRAASFENLQARIRDIPAVIDQLAEWNTSPSHALFGRLDLTRLGMCGHSFGARTTQAVSGEKPALGRADHAERRIKAAMPFSPSPPTIGDPKVIYRDVSIPWMLMTGTNDVAAIGNTTVDDRLSVFPGLPAGDKFEVVLDGAEHSAFSERGLPGDKGKRNPNHHRVILALGTAFWDAYLLGDERAKAWLMGDGPKSVLEPKDRWQKK